MKNTLVKILISLGLFLFGMAATGLGVYMHTEALGLAVSVECLVVFLLLWLITYLGLRWFEDRLGKDGVWLSVALAPVILFLPSVMNSTLWFTAKAAPLILSAGLGIAGGVFFHSAKERKAILLVLFGLFPLIMSLGVYDLWKYKLDYGIFPGEDREPMSFQLMDASGNTVDQKSLEGKVVLFDFWFMSCKPCWDKFPELQRIYERYLANPGVAVYAVNRPLRTDREGECFAAIRKRGYTFPVLLGDQAVMDDFKVYSYPTVVLLNPKGELIYKGKIENAEAKIKSLLAGM